MRFVLAGFVAATCRGLRAGALGPLLAASRVTHAVIEATGGVGGVLGACAIE